VCDACAGVDPAGSADDVLGLAWSRAVSAMTNALDRLPPIPVVQLTGALIQPDVADSSVDLVRQAARISGGAAHFFYAPRSYPIQQLRALSGNSPKLRGHLGGSVRLPKLLSASASGQPVSQRSMTSPTGRFGVSCTGAASVARSPECLSTATGTIPSRIYPNE
jgi:hypothetical protein